MNTRNIQIAEMLLDLSLLAGQNDAAAEDLLSSCRDLLLEPFLDETPSSESIFLPGQTLAERREIYDESLRKRVKMASTLSLSRALDAMREHVLRVVDSILEEKSGE